MNLITRFREAFAWRFTKVQDSTVLALARLNRRRLKNTAFVGITGSAGKTTTKDLALAVLGRHARVSGNAASMNYLAEVAQVVLGARRKDRYVVIEVATSKPGDIETKVALVQPSIAALTVVQREHVKNFDSLEAIAAEKGRLIDALPKHGIAVLNIDDHLVRQIGERTRARRIWFGTSPEADIRLIEATSAYPDPLTLVIEYQGQRHTCITSLHGTHLAVPVLAAIGLGLAAGMPIEECIAALPEVRTTPGRMQIVTTPGGITFVRDDHKAPYWSFQAALDYLRAARAQRKVAVIGTISDYSLSASKVYPKIARQAREAAELVVFVGPHALRALKARQGEDDRSVVGFTDLEEANRFLQGELREGDLVLLKGSNRADHLIRLILARSRPIGCWERGCGWSRFCDVCPRLDVLTAVPIADAAAPATQPPYPAIAVHAVPDDFRPGALAASVDSWLIVGMGNRGSRFAGTPHNVGFEAVDYLAGQLGAGWADDADGSICRGNIGGREVVLFKPATMINVCGPALARLLHRYRFRSDQVVVIHDDADLPLGDVRVKRSGSDGGHKGLRSVFSALGNDGFMPRVRIGVRKSHHGGQEAKALVLEAFVKQDEATVQAALAKVPVQLKTIVLPERRREVAELTRMTARES